MTDGFETFRWEQLARRQKIYIVAAAVLLIGVIGYGIYDRFRLEGEVRQFEHAAAVANEEKEAALEQAAEVASVVKVKEDELEKIEVKRNAKKGEVKREVDAVARDRAEYERAVRERIGKVPSTNELCEQLAALGHPCR